MALFDRLFGKGRKTAAAKAAELRGDLGKAVELYAEAGENEEAARMMVLRAESEPDARARLQHLSQAAKLSAEGSEINKRARQKRAELRLAMAADAAVSALARHEVAEAAKELEAIGMPLEAAEAFARAGDIDGQARALQAAGDVERLEFLLSTRQSEERISRSRDERTKDIEVMLGCGKRREALAALDELLKATPEDVPLRERANGLRARRAIGPNVTVEAAGERWKFVLGDEITIGREGAIKVASNAVSRQHLRLARENGAVVVRDLQTRNGTQLRGVNLAGALALNEGLELKLGREVSCRCTPSARVQGAIEIEIAGERYFACLGPARLPVAGVLLVTGTDGWVELVTDGASAYMGEVEIVPHATLLAGDAIATSRGAPWELKIVAG